MSDDTYNVNLSDRTVRDLIITFSNRATHKELEWAVLQLMKRDDRRKTSKLDILLPLKKQVMTDHCLLECSWDALTEQ